jgi:hypothetical protein
LRKRGGNREQEEKSDARSRKQKPGAAPNGTAGKRDVSGLEKQAWDWINIPAHAKTWKTFLSVCLGELLSLAENLLLAIPDDPIPIYCLPYFHGRQARSTEVAAAKPLGLQSVVRAPTPDIELFKTAVTTLRCADGETRPFLMVTEGTLAIAKESRRVFLESKCCSNKSTYSYESPLAGSKFSSSSGRFSD